MKKAQWGFSFKKFKKIFLTSFKFVTGRSKGKFHTLTYLKNGEKKAQKMCILMMGFHVICPINPLTIFTFRRSLSEFKKVPPSRILFAKKKNFIFFFSSF